MDIPTAPINEASKFFLAWAFKRVGYLWDIKKNAAAFERGLNSLIQSRADAVIELDRAEVEGKLPRNEVVGWVGETEKAIEHGNELLKDFHEGRGGCSLLRPSRYRLARQIVESSQTVAELKENGKFDEYAVPRVPERVQPEPTATIRLQTSTAHIQDASTEFQSVAQTEGASSAHISINAETSQQAQTSASNSGDTSEVQRTSMAQAMEQIWNWLQDPGIVRIGIWGKGGIGKTTIMKNIINFKLYNSNHFDVVLFVTVSRDLNIKKLRQSIGKELSLNLLDEEDDRAARLLYNELRRKKFFLILDDVWERIDLDRLGVPTAKNSGCKVALTTRKETVCRQMETDKEIRVKDLPEDEAWELFCEKAGEVVSPSIEATAQLVCKECHGLPLAIIVVGRALRKQNDKTEWEHALRVLKSSQFGLERMEDELFVPLKFSYDYLKNDTLRDCFLYCSLFPEDYAIDTNRLIDYWVIDGVIKECENLKQASEQGRHYILKELIDSCLLERSSLWNETVKMHDVIRDMAIKITSLSRERGKRFLVNAGKGLDEWLGGNNLEEKDKISLMENDIRSLIDEPNCPELSTLLLQGNDSLEYIPESFFKHMKALRILDLSATRIKSLPQSVVDLVKLRSLILRECFMLRSIQNVGCLKHLWLLDLSYTQIKELPDEIGELTQLRRLNLSYTYKLEKILPGTISRLSLLEDLEMKESFYFGGDEIRADVIYEFRCLRHLYHLTLDITSDYNAAFFCEIFLKLKNLETFILRVGPPDPTIRTCYSKEAIQDGFSERSGKCIEFTHTVDVSHGIARFVHYADKLFLSKHSVLQTVSELGARNLENLRECWVLDCHRMVSMSVAQEEDIMFPTLEILVLHDLRNLVSVWDGKGAAGSFKCLKTVTLSNCSLMLHVLSSDVISELHCLEELKIRDCPSMKQIVVGNVGTRTNNLPNLRYLELLDLYGLTALWKGDLFLPSLRQIKVLNCLNLQRLPLAKNTVPVLQFIEGQQKWWEALIWRDRLTRLHFKSLFCSSPGYSSK